jgi:hypothetical protein
VCHFATAGCLSTSCSYSSHEPLMECA